MSHPDPKNFYCCSETACLQKGLIYPTACTKLRCNLKTASGWGFSALCSKSRGPRSVSPARVEGASPAFTWSPSSIPAP